jgi:formylglycine-generating enzyme required for sulfatase activity
MKKLVLITFLFLAISFQSQANNLVVGTPTISGSTVTFTIKWDNSWLVTTGPSNWDAVWIFVKRQSCVSGNISPWLHAQLSPTGQSVTGSVLRVDTVTDNAGVFVRRSAAGMGNIAQATVTITLASPVNGDNIGVYAMEMVNVPEGQFYIGDGMDYNGTSTFSDGTGTSNPKLITQAIDNTGLGSQNNYTRSQQGSSVDLPSTFPSGYKKFYCMKYEITCAQYVAFLNTLTYDQQLRRQQDEQWNTTPPTSPSGTAYMERWGFRIEIKTPGVSTTSLTPAVYACDANDNGVYDEDCDGLGLPVSLNQNNWLSYLDWCALRPMTEFEYEKSCRGPLNPVAYEYSWGTTDLSNDYNHIDWRCSTEAPQNYRLGLCNCWTGVARRGGSEAISNSDRVHAGATYYGILNMTGGTTERCVGGWGYDYSTFTNANGDGNLSSLGYTNNSIWNSMYFSNRGASYARSEGSRLSERWWWNDGNWGNGSAGRGVRSY